MTKTLEGRWKPGQSGNPKGRAKGSLDWRQKLAMQVREETPALLTVLVDKAKAGDVAALKFLLERGMPLTRAVAPVVEIPGLAAAGRLSDKARIVLDAVARGELAPDVGATLVQALGATARVVEIDDLERRLAALECPPGTPD